MNSLVQSKRTTRSTPLRIFGERSLKIEGQKPLAVKFKGLIILFSADRERVLHKLFKEGRLVLAATPDCLELQKIDRDGTYKVIGRTIYDAAGRFYVNGEPARDKKGKVVSPPAGSFRCVNADTLFPVLGRAWRVNNWSAVSKNAAVEFDLTAYKMPIDPKARYGLAVREKRIAALALPDVGAIHFYQLLADRGMEYIGGMPLPVPSRGKEQEVTLSDHIVDFGLKDLPIGVYDGEAGVHYRKVFITFSVNRANIYYSDLKAGRLCLRTGYPDRIEVIRKIDDKEEIIGQVAIKDNCLLADSGRKIPLDKKDHLSIEEAIEELGGYEVKVSPRQTIPAADFSAYGNSIRFLFRMTRDNYYLPLLRAKKLICRVYRKRVEVGYKAQGEFVQIGRVTFDKKGYLVDTDNKLGKRVRQYHGTRQTVVMEKLVPELGRIEKKLKPNNSINYRRVTYYFGLKPKDRYFFDLLARNLVFRGIGTRIELFADRPTGKELIGAATAATRDEAHPSRLFTEFRSPLRANPELADLLAMSTYGDIRRLFSDGQQVNLLKRLLLFGRIHLVSAGISATSAVKLFYALTCGLELLSDGVALSSDLKAAVSQEAIALMGSAVNLPWLFPERESLTRLYQKVGETFIGTNED